MSSITRLPNYGTPQQDQPSLEWFVSNLPSNYLSYPQHYLYNTALDVETLEDTTERRRQFKKLLIERQISEGMDMPEINQKDLNDFIGSCADPALKMRRSVELTNLIARYRTEIGDIREASRFAVSELLEKEAPLNIAEMDESYFRNRELVEMDLRTALSHTKGDDLRDLGPSNPGATTLIFTQSGDTVTWKQYLILASRSSSGLNSNIRFIDIIDSLLNFVGISLHPIADKDGFVLVDGVRYMNIDKWFSFFKEKEGVVIAKSTISNRLKKFGKTGITARTNSGLLLNYGFYSEDDVREVCSDFFEYDLVDASGILHKNNEIYASTRVISERLLIPYKRVLSKVKNSSKIRFVRAKLQVSGVICTLYSDYDIRIAFSDFLSPSYLKADEDGFFFKDDQRYGNLAAISDELGIPHTTLKRRLEVMNSIEAESYDGKNVRFYLLSEAREACIDLLQSLDLPKVDDEGFFENHIGRWGTINAVCKKIGVTPPAVISRIGSLGVDARTMNGRSKIGRKCTLYFEDDLLSICEDLLNGSLVELNDNDFFEKDRIEYKMLHHLEYDLGISRQAMGDRLEKKGAHVNTLHGRTKMGKLCILYSKPDICSLCDDILNTALSRVNSDGFIEVGGIKHVVIDAFADLYDLSPGVVRGRIKRAELEEVSMLSRIGGRCKVYPFNKVLSACSDLLTSLQFDTDGFLIEDNKKYGTRQQWAKKFGITWGVVSYLIEKYEIDGIKRRINGRCCTLYCELDISSFIISYLENLENCYQVDESGIFYIGDEQYASFSAYSREFGIPTGTIGERVKKMNISGIKSRLKSGQIHDFYPKSKVFEACADLIEKKRKK
jgi:hypothetical protein